MDKIKDYEKWKEHQDKLKKELEEDISKLIDKYYYDKNLEMESIINTLSDFSEQQYHIYYQIRDELSFT